MRIGDKVRAALGIVEIACDSCKWWNNKDCKEPEQLEKSIKTCNYEDRPDNLRFPKWESAE